MAELSRRHAAFFLKNRAKIVFVCKNERVRDLHDGYICVHEHEFCKLNAPVEQVFIGRSAVIFYKISVDLRLRFIQFGGNILDGDLFGEGFVEQEFRLLRRFGDLYGFPFPSCEAAEVGEYGKEDIHDGISDRFIVGRALYEGIDLRHFVGGVKAVKDSRARDMHRLERRREKIAIKVDPYFFHGIFRVGVIMLAGVRFEAVKIACRKFVFYAVIDQGTLAFEYLLEYEEARAAALDEIPRHGIGDAGAVDVERERVGLVEYIDELFLGAFAHSEIFLHKIVCIHIALFRAFLFYYSKKARGVQEGARKKKDSRVKIKRTCLSAVRKRGKAGDIRKGGICYGGLPQRT